DLLPFEEAKLYGHNSVHALLGSLARLRGCTAMSQVRRDQTLFSLGRQALLAESGAALIATHGRTGDPLFTEPGFKDYSDDLLRRITNPFLHDKVDRIIRDPLRKLGWSDRFFGTMRLTLRQGITPECMALGAAATALYAMEAEKGSGGSPRELLLRLWGSEPAAAERDRCLSLMEKAMPRLSDWRS
ncbi:MAG: hypothetical protein ABSG63_20525, partial [Spirochaetia bacterium]